MSKISLIKVTVRKTTSQGEIVNTELPVELLVPIDSISCMIREAKDYYSVVFKKGFDPGFYYAKPHTTIRDESVEIL